VEPGKVVHLYLLGLAGGLWESTFPEFLRGPVLRHLGSNFYLRSQVPEIAGTQMVEFGL
jgi:hypothetical protein